jgi:predicted nuclease of predicted toxin-antitoxin system
MSLRIVIDMNLSLEWIPLLEQAGWTAIHWSSIGDHRADDSTIMAWASANDYTVFTHDLDFGSTLALTHAGKTSVIQVRAQRVLPEHIGQTVIGALKQFEQDLAVGALVVVEPAKSHVRVLPI